MYIRRALGRLGSGRLASVSRRPQSRSAKGSTSRLVVQPRIFNHQDGQRQQYSYHSYRNYWRPPDTQDNEEARHDSLWQRLALGTSFAAGAVGLALSSAESQAHVDSLETQDAKEELIPLPAANHEANKKSLLGQLFVLHQFYVLKRLVELGLIYAPVLIALPITLIPFCRKYWWRLLRWALETSGGCWIKLGQWASTRPDLFPDEMISNATNLQDRVPAHSFYVTREIIKEAYGCEIEELFDDFSELPIASGAIAQVHRAKLKINGLPVAVKVLHPGVQEIVDLDLHIMGIGAYLVSCLPTTEWLSLPEAIEQFKGRMRLQTDLRLEANNLRIFNHNFKDHKTIVFPKLIGGLSRKTVLVESFEIGMPVNYYIRHPDLNGGADNKKLARIGLNAYLKMMLFDNFVHADLHPGNILVRRSADNELQAVLLDVGLVSQLSDTDWLHFKDLFKCIVQGDGKGGAELMVRHARDSKISPEAKEAFTKEMDVLFSTIRHQKISEINVGLFLSNIMSTLRKYQVKIEANFATLCVATVVLEGIGRQLDPEINILDQSVPFLFWSGKASLEDQMVYVREKAKDEMLVDGQLRPPSKDLMKKMVQLWKDIFYSGK